jgi:hypothetical protein
VMTATLPSSFPIIAPFVMNKNLDYVHSSRRLAAPEFNTNQDCIGPDILEHLLQMYSTANRMHDFAIY